MIYSSDMTRESGQPGWISHREASEITGIPVRAIEYAGRAGRIVRRERHGRCPTLARASVLEWAESFRAQEDDAQRRGEKRPGSRETSKRVVPFPETVDDDWLTMTEAGEILGTSEATIRCMARSGRLTSRYEGRWLVHRDAVAAYAAEEARWITWMQAARLIGAPRSAVESWIRDGRLRTRQAAPSKPSVERSSAEALVPEWREIAAEREARRQARRSRLEARRQVPGPPGEGDEWLTTSQAAEILGCSPRLVRRRFHSERLSGIQRDGQIWLRRNDVERFCRGETCNSAEGARIRGEPPLTRSERDGRST